MPAARTSPIPAVVAALLEEMGLAEAALGMQRPTDALQAAHRSRIDTARALMQQHSARGVPAFIFDDGQGCLRSLPASLLITQPMHFARQIHGISEDELDNLL